MKLSAAATGALSGAAYLTTRTVSAQSSPQPPTCRSGVHVIVARASTEPQGLGILRSVAEGIAGQIPDSDTVSVEYPATLTRYPESQLQGVGNLTELVTSYGDACPGHRMALLGYSQGAHVIGDVLIGADYRDLSRTFPNRPGVGRQYVDSVCGVILMGDPANVPTQSFLVGNSTDHGFFPRANAYQWYNTGLSSRMQSYCDAEDTYCDSGSSSAVHQSYVPAYGDAAVDFVLSQCNAANQTTPRPTTSAGGSASGSGYPVSPPSASGGSASGSYPVPRPTTGGSGGSASGSYPPRPTTGGSGGGSASGSYPPRPTTHPTASGSGSPSGSYPASHPPSASGSGSNTVSRPTSGPSYPASRPTVNSSPSSSHPITASASASGSYSLPPRPTVAPSGNSTSGVNGTEPGGSGGNSTGTITETEPDVTPAPTSNGDQGIYTTRASSSAAAPAGEPSGGPSANAASRLMASGSLGYVVTLVLGGALAVALNL